MCNATRVCARTWSQRQLDAQFSRSSVSTLYIPPPPPSSRSARICHYAHMRAGGAERYFLCSCTYTPINHHRCVPTAVIAMHFVVQPSTSELPPHDNVETRVERKGTSRATYYRTPPTLTKTSYTLLALMLVHWRCVACKSLHSTHKHSNDNDHYNAKYNTCRDPPDLADRLMQWMRDAACTFCLFSFLPIHSPFNYSQHRRRIARRRRAQS